MLKMIFFKRGSNLAHRKRTFRLDHYSVYFLLVKIRRSLCVFTDLSKCQMPCYSLQYCRNIKILAMGYLFAIRGKFLKTHRIGFFQFHLTYILAYKSTYVKAELKQYLVKSDKN